MRDSVDLAIAVFFLEGPAAALTTLEQVPEKERFGDYLLLKCQCRDETPALLPVLPTSTWARTR
jgi:hypothetical protein